MKKTSRLPARVDTGPPDGLLLAKLVFNASNTLPSHEPETREGGQLVPRSLAKWDPDRHVT